MQRNYHTQALLIKSEPLGDSHRKGTFLAPDLGLFQAAFFGARSLHSKLGPFAVPFQHLELWLYHQPVKNFWKVLDAREIQPLEGIRADLRRFYTASLWAELALYSHAEGDWQTSYRLLTEGLTLLAFWPSPEVRLLNLQFCLKWVTFLGFAGDFSSSMAYKLTDFNHDNNEEWEKTKATRFFDFVHEPLGRYQALEDIYSVEKALFHYLRELLGRQLLSLTGWDDMMEIGARNENGRFDSKKT